LLVSEVNILRELRNPFIVRYYDRIVDKASTRLYIVMEHCAGGDLGKVIKMQKREGKLVDERLIWKVLAQSTLALKDCHRHEENGKGKPILHRDIKPANILLDAQQNIKFGDFGLAKELSSESKLAQTNVGTPFYMSPEIINEKSYDERSDIWSLGCLVYELAALHPPFDAKNQISLAMKINAGRFARIPKHYSDELFNVIRSMLQVDRRRRPKVEDLERVPAMQTALSEANRLLRESKGVAAVVEAPRPVVAAEGSAVLAAQRQVLERDQKELAKKTLDVEKRERAVDARAQELDKREQEVIRRETSVKTLKRTLESAQQQQQQQQRTVPQRRPTRQSEMPPPPPVSTSAGFAIHVDQENVPEISSTANIAASTKWQPGHKENERPASAVPLTGLGKREAGAALAGCAKPVSRGLTRPASAAALSEQHHPNKRACTTTTRVGLSDVSNKQTTVPVSANARCAPVKVELRALLARAGGLHAAAR
jgi:NIMA (never in mitosis gene a)-related kinase